MSSVLLKVPLCQNIDFFLPFLVLVQCCIVVKNKIQLIYGHVFRINF